jgi:positive regulator of sigma E activity
LLTYSTNLEKTRENFIVLAAIGLSSQQQSHLNQKALVSYFFFYVTGYYTLALIAMLRIGKQGSTKLGSGILGSTVAVRAYARRFPHATQFQPLSVRQYSQQQQQQRSYRGNI